MHQADLNHPNPSLQDKLEQLYGLNRHKAIDLGFRPPYVDLLQQFGNPHLTLPPVIHIAGTNGKGSITAMLRAMLEAGGYNVHAYTSPHLVRFNERIVLNGREIGDELLESLIDEAVHLNAGAPITFFEITTALSFAAFSSIPADILLLEVGLGGRLDSTNILPKPLVSVINKISLDHTEFLGTTYREIAKEKAGIMKYDTPCVIGVQSAEGLENGVLYSFVDRAVETNSPLFCAGKEWRCEPEGPEGMLFTMNGSVHDLYPRPNLIGEHQIDNAGAALATLELIKDRFPVSQEARAKGLQSIRWPGRLEHRTQGPLAGLLPMGWELWCDGGHNDSAGAALGVQAAAWQAADGKPLHLIAGMKSDKNPAAFLAPLAPYAASFTPTRPEGIGACISADQMQAHMNQNRTRLYPESQAFPEILRRIIQDHPTPGRILICGSLYLMQKCM